jgi:hypothetical protein
MITYQNLGVKGRLGNSLFQLAATIGIGDSINERVVFPSDWMHRKYFSVPDELFTDRKNIPVGALDASTLVNYMSAEDAPYLQDQRLFKNSMDKIRAYLTPSELALDLLHGQDLLSLPPTRPRLCMHVRRGDKIYDPGVHGIDQYFVQPTAAYYFQGAATFDADVCCGSVCCFSDDIEWCKRYIPAHFYGNGIAHPKEHEPEFHTAVPMDWMDLFMMSWCDYFVISGSTLGIWGALLANVPPDHVIRPDIVYGPMLSRVDSELLFDPHWQVLSVT